MTLTQLELVKAMLEAGPACGTDFLQERIPRYGARVWDLRRAGYVIETRPCSRPDHRHRTRQIEHVLVGVRDLDSRPTTSAAAAGEHRCVTFGLGLSVVAVGDQCGRCIGHGRQVLA